MDATQILTSDEIRTCVSVLRRHGKRSTSTFENLVIFRLACCCGLRRKEIRWLNVDDLMVTGPRPAIRIRKEATKGQEGKRRARLVPLWWDRGTLEDLASWRDRRLTACQSFVPGETDGRLEEGSIARRWRTVIRKCLGEERATQVSIHAGRHSFCSHALAGGRTLVEVRDAAGHSNISTTSIYLHVLHGADVPDLFEVGADK